jgi:hypothetical protein
VHARRRVHVLDIKTDCIKVALARLSSGLDEGLVSASFQQRNKERGAQILHAIIATSLRFAPPASLRPRAARPPPPS